MYQSKNPYKYSKEEMIHFVSRVVKASLSVFQSSQKPLA